MPRPTFEDIAQLPDIIPSEGYELEIGFIPGSLDFQGARNLKFKCLTAQIPGSSVEQVDVQLWGHTLLYRGKYQTSNALFVNYVEDKFLSTYTVLNTWREFIVGTISGNSAATKAGYASDSVFLNIYDQENNVAGTIRFFGFYPSEIREVDLSSYSTLMMQVPVTFSYDYFTVI